MQARVKCQSALKGRLDIAERFHGQSKMPPDVLAGRMDYSRWRFVAGLPRCPGKPAGMKMNGFVLTIVGLMNADQHSAKGYIPQHRAHQKQNDNT